MSLRTLRAERAPTVKARRSSYASVARVRGLVLPNSASTGVRVPLLLGARARARVCRVSARVCVPCLRLRTPIPGTFRWHESILCVPGLCATSSSGKLTAP